LILSLLRSFDAEINFDFVILWRYHDVCGRMSSIKPLVDDFKIKAFK